jgi:type IV secretory pathway TrbF-like protein
MRPKHPTTHVSRRVRLPEFMWQALEHLTDYTNEKAIANPNDYVNVSGLIESIILASVKVQILEMLAATSPEFRTAIEAWVAWQIENDPRTAVVFSTGVWSFTMGRTN